MSNIKTNISVNFRRVKLSLNKARREELFKTLEKRIEQLRRLLDSSDRIASLQQARGVSRKIADLKGMRQFWRKTDKLYRLLERSWNCDCRELHSASLLLEHRTSGDAIDFHLCLFNGSGDREDLSWSGQETKARILKCEDNGLEGIEGRIARVSFAPSLPQGEALPVPRVTLVDTSSQGVPGNRPPMFMIHNLCSELPNFQSMNDQTKAFCLEDESCCVSLHPIRRRTLACTAAEDMISLDALLRQSASRRLPRQARYQIGMILASSYLQLKSSPWIGRQWDKSHILFPKGDGARPGQVLVNKPYICRDFDSGVHQAGHDDQDGDQEWVASDMRGLKDRTLKNLGIMLLELCFDRALEEYGPRMEHSRPESTSQAGIQTVDHHLDMVAALEWLEDLAGEGVPEFSEAVMWCLTTTVDDGTRRQAGRWRDELFEKVILPLKSCHDDLTYRQRV